MTIHSLVYGNGEIGGKGSPRHGKQFQGRGQEARAAVQLSGTAETNNGRTDTGIPELDKFTGSLCGAN